MRDALPTLKDLPAVAAFYAFIGVLWFAVFHNAAYRAVVSSAAFWRVVSVAVACFLAGALFAHFNLGREDA